MERKKKKLDSETEKLLTMKTGEQCLLKTTWVLTFIKDWPSG